MKQIKFSYEDEEFSGVLVKDDEELTIKLESGYNIILPKKDVKILEEKDIKEKKTAKKKRTSKGPAVRILHTGGTIASKVDYETGAVTAQFTEEDIISLFPELNSIANVSSELVGNMQSEMMRFAHWNLLAKAVKKAVDDGVKGVIITHGTDTIHYTAAALTYALEECPIPVILVGSQRSSDRPSSDAASNLLTAARFASEGSYQGVGICMHESIEDDNTIIIPGARARKMHTSRRDAIRAINDTPYARITYPGLEVEALRDYPKNKGAFSVREYDEQLRIGIFYAHPNTFAKELLAYGECDGLVVGLYGIGHLPTEVTDDHNKEHENIKKVIKALTKKMPIVGAPQTIYGRVDMNVYSPGRTLLEAGVLGQGCDLTIESAYAKLAWLLSNEPKKVRELYNKDLRGELSNRIRADAYD